MDAGTRIQRAFQGSPTEVSAFLRLVRLNATTTLAMLFQNPAVLDASQAAEESVELLLREAGGHCQDAGLNNQQREQFLNAHRQAAEDFRRALEDALEAGVPSDDRAALALRVAKYLRLPM